MNGRANGEPRYAPADKAKAAPEEKAMAAPEREPRDASPDALSAWLDGFLRDPVFLERYPCYAAILGRLSPVADPSVKRMAKVSAMRAIECSCASSSARPARVAAWPVIR